MLAPVLKNACVQVICHKPLVCHGKCSFSLFFIQCYCQLVRTWTPRSSLPQNLAFHILKLLMGLCFCYCFVLICYPSAMCSVQVVETIIHFITDKLSNFKFLQL